MKSFNVSRKIFKGLKQDGISMVEVLIALLVLSVGSLGYLSMQTTMLTSTMDANQRSVASWAAQDLVERILSNREALSDYEAAAGTTCDDDPPDCIAADCSSANLAVYDVWIAMCSADANLLNPELEIECTDVDGNAEVCDGSSFVTVTMNWSSKSIADESEFVGVDLNSDLAIQTFTTTVRP